MPTPERIHQRIQDAIDAFNKDIPKLQNEAFRRVMSTLKELDTKSGKLVSNISNLKKLRRLKDDLLESILTANYTKELKDYTSAFLQTENLQTAYFSSTFSKFKPLDFVAELRTQAITDVGITLGKIGIEAEVITPMQDIIKRNLVSNSSFGDLADQMRVFLTKTDQGSGVLSRHAKTFTTDALNTFAAEYNQAVTEDLGLKWSKYLGAIVGGSREFCIHLVAKKFVHESEIPTIINDFPGSPFSLSKKGHINGKAVSLAGLKKGTTVTNFNVVRGGWRCKHQLIAVSDQSIPENLRKKFK